MRAGPAKSFVIASLLLVGLGAGCATTHIENTWRKPGVTRAQYERILLIAPTRESGLRRAAEETLAKEVKGGVPSYPLLSDEALADKENIAREVEKGGYDAVLTFNVVAVDEQTEWAPGGYSVGYYGYGAWPMYDPGYVYTTTIVRVDVNVYDAKSRDLVWASTSRKEDPSSVQDLVHDVAKSLREEMRKQGVVE